MITALRSACIVVGLFAVARATPLAPTTTLAATASTTASSTAPTATVTAAASATTTLDELLPAGLVTEPGLVLVMFTEASCPGAEAFAPTFVATSSWLPGVRHRIIERTPAMLDLLHLSLPLFVLFRDGHAVDVHGGIDQQVTAHSTTWGALAFALAARNGLSTNTPWAVAMTPWPTRASYNHASLKFVVGEGLSLAGADFRRALLSEVRLARADFTGALFERTVFAHVDVTGAVFSDEQASAIVWVNATCPDGTTSRSHGDTCVGHTSLSTGAR